MRATVLLADGRKLEADIKPGDWVRFERAYGMNVSDLSMPKLDAEGNPVVDDDGDPVRVTSPVARSEHNYFIAYSALKRTKQYEGDFDSFLDLIDEDIDVVEEAVPLERPNDSSQLSPPVTVATPTPSP